MPHVFKPFALPLVLVGALFLTAAAQASASPLDDANFVRQQAGLPLLSQAPEDEAASQVNETLLNYGSGGIDEDGGDEYCGCAIYDDDDGDTPPVYATERYRQLGGTSKAAFWTYFKEANPRVNRTVWALLLDPRARSMRWSENDEATSITVFLDPAAKFTTPQISHTGNFNLLGEVPIFLLLPSLKTKTTIYRGAGSKWYPEVTAGGFDYDDNNLPPIFGADGARMVNLALVASNNVERRYYSNTTDGMVLAHSTRYRVGNTEFKTSAMPQSIVKRKFKSAKSMTGRYRKVMNRRFATAPRAVRKALAIVDGWTTLKTHSGSGTSVTGWTGEADSERPYFFSFDRWHLIGERQALGHMIALHELAHLLDLTGLTYGGQRAFQKQFSKSRNYKRCWPYGGPGMCVQKEEVLADQMAFGMGANKSIRTGYGTAPTISRRQFNKLFSIWWAPKPMKYGFSLGTGGLIEGGTEDGETEELYASSVDSGLIVPHVKTLPSTKVQVRAAFRAR